MVQSNSYSKLEENGIIGVCTFDKGIDWLMAAKWCSHEYRVLIKLLIQSHWPLQFIRTTPTTFNDQRFSQEENRITVSRSVVEMRASIVLNENLHMIMSRIDSLPACLVLAALRCSIAIKFVPSFDLLHCFLRLEQSQGLGLRVRVSTRGLDVVVFDLV